MPTRRSLLSHWKSRSSRQRQAERIKRRGGRRPLLEALEQRQLLAIGPQLAGIQPDEGDLLRNGDVREISPRELKFLFNDGAVIDESTLSGIRLTRSDDPNFATAVATSDFNTSGQVVVDFRALSPGASGNGIRIEVIKNGSPSASLVSVVGGVIQVELNTTTGTTASQLVTAINAHPQANRLVSASIRRGTGTTNISQPAITYSPIVTSGANAAMAVTDLGVGNSLQMKLTATQPGPAGLNIALLISRRDFGGVAPPRVTVSGREVSVEVNSNAASPTTAGELVNAINANAAARALLTASLPIGSQSTVIGNRVPTLRLTLAGVGDIPVVPGFIGLGDSPREVVMRFSQPLPDAFYHVEIAGAGASALRDVDGVAFGDKTDDAVDDGAEFGLGFQLDLGAQVLAVVPQPLTRNSVTSIQTQARTQINVYFNNDDLFPTRIVTVPNPNNNPSVNPTVVDPAFYQLILTNETVENTDDRIFRPTRIEYDPASDLAVLIFASDIEDLGSGSGTFRLRIGTDESLPVPPLRAISQSDEGSSFATSQAVGLELEVIGNGTTLVGSPTLTLTGSIDATTQASSTVTFQFVNTTTGGSASGTNIPIPFNPTMDQAAIAGAIAAAINQSSVGRATVAGRRVALTGTLAAVPSAGLTTVRVERLSSLVISSAIEPKPYNLDFPGGIDDLGHREIPEEAHVFFGADAHAGITTLSYNFRTDIGNDPAGRPLTSVITEAQKQRAREVFHIYGEHFGVQFIESDLDGLTVATGDMRAIAPAIPTGPRDGLTSAVTTFQDPLTGNVTGLLILDNAENWDDSYGATDNPARLSWFEAAMQGVGTLLGLGVGTDLPPAATVTAGFVGPTLQFGNPLESVYPGAPEIVHGQYLYRPEGQDIDLFRIDIPETGLFSAEVVAERQLSSSLLDSIVMLYRDVPGSLPELIARNDDYYSRDSFFELELTAGTYWVGVSASGNDQYDPNIVDSGFGGTTEGQYDLRLNFRPDANRELLDATGVAVDGDGNGTPGGIYNFWFEAQDESRTIYVDKVPPTVPTGALGSIRNPHTLISTALSDANFRAINGDDVIVRILGNGGADLNVATLTDNVPYQIGFSQNGGQLTDGASLEVPKGVTVMIDSGAVIKSRRGRLAVGSSSSTIDRSESALQVLGTPVVLNSAGSIVRDLSGNAIAGSVYFTSINDDTIGTVTGGIGHPLAAPGDWGGLAFQADIDHADANRVDLEDRGIFLNYVNNADIRYGGGSVVVDGIPQSVSPIHMTDARATATFNSITLSADAAISASPDTFEETNFHSPEHQFSPFTSEYTRVGPDLYGNRLVNNSINGLFVRVQTPAGGVLRSLTVAGRFDDREITHIVAENLVIQGTPGGPIQQGERPVAQFVTLEPTTVLAIVGDGSTVTDGHTFTITAATTGVPIVFEFVNAAAPRPTTGTRPVVFNTTQDRAALATVIANAITAAGIQATRDVSNVTLRAVLNVTTASPAISLSGATLPAGTYNYKVVFVDANGNEGLASIETRDVTINSPQNAVRLLNLPVPSAGFISRRIYRSDTLGNANGIYTLVTELNGSDTFFVDNGSTFGGTLQPNTANLRARLDGRLAIDPGIVVKLDGATIEARFGAQLIAEGLVGQEVIFTSINDDTYGGGGTFDASNNGFQAATPGEWGGLFLGNSSRGSLDRAQVSFGGGVTRIEGSFTAFNAIEIQQADVRIAHSAFRNNANGTGGQASPNRAGRGENDPGLIFVRGAQPVIVSNMMLENSGPVISIDANALDFSALTDFGRSTYNRGEAAGLNIDRLPGYVGNEGPLVRLNALSGNDINGMQVRGTTLTTQGVWDDSDIVHVLLDQTVYIPDFHTYGGLRLESSASQSLVVKLSGAEAGFTATGRPLDIDDRIGGSLQIIGQPGQPVVFTSIDDETVGAGFTPDGTPQVRTNTGAQFATAAVVGDLRLIQPDPAVSATLVGNVGVSTDGLGTDSSGTLQADIPAGSSVEFAFLHVATRTGNAATFPPPGPFNPGTISFEGQAVPITYLPNVPNSTNENFETGRADVTALVRARVGSAGGIFNFIVDETTTVAPNNIEGTSLTVIYSNPSLPLRSVFVLEGGLTGPEPQVAQLDFSQPIDLNDPNFTATLALGIQFSFPTPPPAEQFSTVDVNGQRLTTSAGSHDDSAVTPPFDGNLITVGGVGDSFANPVNPFSTTPTLDDELYTLTPLLTDGSSQLVLTTANPSDDDSIFLAVLQLSGDVALARTGQPGDWRSIEINQFANDRNVGIATEREPAELAAPGNNFNPNNAEFLGGLAPHVKAGDESLRLGFEVHGVIAEPSDYDVYSFDAPAGTEVWFDIDRTSFALDTVIELLDANGVVHQGVVLANPSRTVLARSDNSIDEALIAAEEATLTVRPLQKSAFNVPDRYTTNPKDAGMRVVLPGPLNTTNTYYLRVRSNSPNLSNLADGRTKGLYQLQIRLREQDEIPGTTVQYSDIRFATNGIEINGQPTHSPLLGEATETLNAAGIDTNDNFNAPEVLGNVLNTDRAALSIAGALDLSVDVDWYQFDVEYDSIQGQGTFLVPRHASLAFDVDYADGFARPNTNIWVFNDAGVLVAVGRDGNIADDRAAALKGANVDDLTRGSAGALDPFIGPIELPANGTESGRYFVAIASNAIIPAGMDQFLTPVPGNPLLRLEPTNSVPRIVEDHVNGSNLSSIAQAPQIPVLFDATSVQPFSLSDVGLLVIQNAGGNQNRVVMVDAFTGASENVVGVFQANIDDVALHPTQGLLYGLSVPLQGNPTDANTGNYIQIDPRSTNTTNLGVNLGDDGIETNNQDPMNAMPAAIRSNNTNGVGIRFDAIAIGDDGTIPLSGYAIGSRFPGLGVTDTNNLLYEFNPTTGVAFSINPPGDRGSANFPLTNGAWTNIAEHAALNTAFDPVPGNSNPQAIAPDEATTIDFSNITIPIIHDGTSTLGTGPQTFTVSDGVQSRTFEFNAGPEVRVFQDPTALVPIRIRDADTFRLDTILYEFDTGSVLDLSGVSPASLSDGDRITITPSIGQPPIPQIFEFDTIGDGIRNVPGSILINTSQFANAAQITAEIVLRINLVSTANPTTFNVVATAIGTRLSLTNENVLSPVVVNAGGIVVDPNTRPGVRPGTFAVPAEESMSSFELADAVDVAITTPAGHDASSEGNRLNFSNAIVGDFTILQARGVFTNIASNGNVVTAGAFPVNFLARDTAQEVAARMAQAINIAFNASVASLAGDVVELINGFSFTSASQPPLSVGGVAPGGDISGLAWVGNRLFAVSGDEPFTARREGGLYEIRFPQSFFADADYIETSTALNDITFTGLAAGPSHIENGRYANILFGIDTFGVLHAFDTDGISQPIFADGQSSVATGVFGADGLAFSNLDYNLWHTTDARRGDAGHGVEEVVDGSRAAENPAGNQSWYFGYEPQVFQGLYGTQTRPSNSFDYDFIGGAQGSLISNPFSLAGFSSEDLPTLYYNYFLETENATAALSGTEFMRDSFRVYASGDDGVWHLVSTNNSSRGTNIIDEYDDTNLFDTIIPDVQENFDVGDRNAPVNWRQARIPLGTFAGQSNLRLRFDFDTAGGRGPRTDGLLRQNTVGEEIRAADAALLRDGQTFTLRTTDAFGAVQFDVFELDFGHTLVAPGGASLDEGDSFTVNGTIYIFDDAATITDPTTNVPNSVAVPFAKDDSALAVANSIALTIQANPPVPLVTTGSLVEPALSSTQPTNDTLTTAIDSTLRGITATFQANGAIGDNPTQPNAALDVDLVRLDMQVGDTVNADLDSNVNSPLFDGFLRVFDSTGVELAFNSLGTAPGETSNGRDPFLSYTATVTGTYYVGVSDASNPFYNPRSQTVASAAPNTVRREYQLELSVVDPAGLLHQRGHRVNLPNAETLTTIGTPIGFVEGAPSVLNGFPINLHINMSAADVANEISLALGSFYANGAPGIFQTSDEVITIIGHTFFSQSAGPLLGQPLGVSEPLYGDLFGAFEASTNFDGTTGPGAPGALRLQNNDHEGLYIDDFIIGAAERGELVSGGIISTNFVANTAQPGNEINVGPYQLEIRRAEDFGISLIPPVPTLLLTQSFASNSRLGDQTTITAVPGQLIWDGLTFEMSDGLGVLTFEFDDDALDGIVNNARGNGVAPGHVAMPFRSSQNSNEIAELIRDTLNNPAVQTRLKITAALADGAVTGTLSTSSVVNLFGNAIVSVETSTADRNVTAIEPNDTTSVAVDTGIGTSGITTFVGTGNIGDNPALTTLSADADLFSVTLSAGQIITVDVDASQVGSTLDSILIVFDSQGFFRAFNYNFNGGDPFIQFTAPSDDTYYIGVSGFANFNYSPFVAGSGAFFGGTFSTGDYTIRITADFALGLTATQSTTIGDSNRDRDQGQLIIQSNTIRDSLGFGIIAGPGVRDLSTLAPLAGDLPHAGPVRVTREVNSERLVPGVVIENNVVANNRGGGIQFSGDANPAGQQLASLAFGRIVNNTVVGRSAGTGIEVGPNASPTLLNNIVADFATGISVAASSVSTVIGGTLYRGNSANTLGIGAGDFPVILANSTVPLFVDQVNGNYYLAPNSRAIDSSVNSLPDRPALTLVRGPLGINPSPILAPKEDALGQSRVDDPAVPSLPGQGSNVFKDRGALDRADFVGPTPFLVAPQDNDSLGQDTDVRSTFVNLTNQTLQHFSIQLLDGVEPSDPQDGTGANDRSVRGDRLTLSQDDVKLVEGIDYKFTYDATNNIIRLTPLAGIWEPDHRYDIRLSNSRGFLITAPDGSQVVDGDSFNLSDKFGNLVNFEFDSGYVLQVPQTLALQIPVGGGALITDRATITVTDSATAKTVVFEFDLDGFVTQGNQRIPFTRTSSANEVAQAIVTAMQAADVGLSPVNHVNFGGRAVHLGTKPTHTVNVSNSPFTTTGQVAGISDGQTFLVDDGTRQITFEFTSTGNITGGNRAIAFTFAQTNEQIAQSIVSAITSAGLGLAPRYVALSNGLINVGGNLRHLINAANSTLTLTGEPGATPEFGLKIPTIAGLLNFTQIMDGEEFTITNGLQSLTIELDSDGIVSPSPNPQVVINFTTSTTVTQLANAIAIAIRNANIGLSPANAGGGIINLLNASRHTIDLTNSSFTQRGTAGVPASVAIPFQTGSSFAVGTTTRAPINTAVQIAGAITTAINTATATSLLQGVVATQQGPEINIDGVGSVTGLGTLLTSDIVDVAGNPLKANRDDGTTQFTITIASGLDYGDAPAPYPTRLANDGARHLASSDFVLGTGIDIDFDGQPTARADGDDLASSDDENGVVIPAGLLVAGSIASVPITASRNGFVDAWIDFNKDGDWNDAGEQVLVARAVVGGNNNVPVLVSGTALPGETFARFRLSSVGRLTPTGEAADGEVEDYLVNINGNPWHNADNPLDVDDSGFIVPLDALIVINYINSHPGQANLPAVNTTGNFVDTNADGSSSPIDVLLVVNRLNNPVLPAEGEAGVDADATERFSTQVVIDQRIGVYEQQEAHAQIQQTIREANRAGANDAVFGGVDTFTSTLVGYDDAVRPDGDETDDLDDLTLAQAWESGVDGIFTDWE